MRKKKRSHHGHGLRRNGRADHGENGDWDQYKSDKKEEGQWGQDGNKKNGSSFDGGSDSRSGSSYSSGSDSSRNTGKDAGHYKYQLGEHIKDYEVRHSPRMSN